MPTFTTDWVTEWDTDWRQYLGELIGQPNRTGLELGTYEGRSALWFASNILTGSGSVMHTVDCDIKPHLLENIAESNGSVVLHNAYTNDFLVSAEFSAMSVDFAYIDADHSESAVASDSLLTWPRLNVGGVLVWDDYGWKTHLPLDQRPQAAIDAFLESQSGRFEMLKKDYQVVIRKTA